MSPIEETLKQHFPKILDTEVVEGIITHGRLESIDEGDYMMDIGSAIRQIPMIVSGTVKVMREDDEGHELLLYYLKAGETCAMSLTCCIEGRKSEIRAVAVRAIYNPATGGVLMVGTTASFGNGDEGFAVMVDANGVIQWSKVYGGAGADYFQDAALDGAGGFYLSGYSSSFGGTQNNLWLVRTDANGASLCNESNAAFIENTISNTVAYADFSSTALNDIVSTDVALTVRNSSAFAFGQNPATANVLCTTIGVQEVSSNTISVYPNPAGSSLNFSFGVNAADAKGLVIYNALGAKVYETTLSNVTSVFTADISNLANGMYTAVVFMNNSQVTAKFTVAK
jgi:hypothetical protein